MLKGEHEESISGSNDERKIVENLTRSTRREVDPLRYRSVQIGFRADISAVAAAKARGLLRDCPTVTVGPVESRTSE
jgi:hypothetical protein